MKYFISVGNLFKKGSKDPAFGTVGCEESLARKNGERKENRLTPLRNFPRMSITHATPKSSPFGKLTRTNTRGKFDEISVNLTVFQGSRSLILLGNESMSAMECSRFLSNEYRAFYPKGSNSFRVMGDFKKLEMRRHESNGPKREPFDVLIPRSRRSTLISNVPDHRTEVQD